MQPRISRFLQLGFALAFGVSLGGASRADAADPIRIGAVLPLSGTVGLYGQQAKLGLDLAAKEINAAGGILGRPVELIYEDDKTNPQAAIAATRKVVGGDGALAVIGPITSMNLDAMVPELATLKTPLLYATNYEGGKCGRYFFAFSTVPNQELAPLVDYMAKTYGKAFYLLGLDRPWPHNMFDATAPIVAKSGGRIVGTRYFKAEDTDYAGMAAGVAATGAKVLVFAAKGAGMDFIATAQDSGLTRNTTLAFLGLSETDLGLFGDKGQNMHVVVPFVAADPAPAVRAFVAKVKANAGADAVVSNYVATHYNALMAVKAALVKAGKVDKEALVDALTGLAIDSPTGKVTIGVNHHATMNMYLAKTQGKDLVVVRALGEIAPQPGCR